MTRDWARLDEDDVRVRPGKGSRPRTRRRPAHDDAVSGFVVAVDRGRYTCLVEGEGGARARKASRGTRTVTAMRARELGRKAVVVGDHVGIVGDVTGAADTLARVVRVEKRTSTLRRTADDTDPVERVIVANADRLVIVTALADPEPRPRMIDRCLVAAYVAGLEPLLCLTKSDLAPPDSLLETYAPLGVPHYTTRKGQSVDDLRERLEGSMSVLVGHSGVGKSTLVNALVPDAERAVSAVNPVTGRGRHTSSSAIALPLASGWIIDTPGVRGFGLAHVETDDVLGGAFPDLAEHAAEECPPHCTHRQDDCSLDAWVAEGNADPSRLDALRRLLASREGEDND